MSAIFALPSCVCFLAAAYLAANGSPHFGWFIFAGALVFVYPSGKGKA